ncbi:MAG: LPS-assembly protein LptD [Sulfurovum sp.]|nr:LPS-assembly protein LptD [Sulfurovum sp.]
MFRLLVSLWIFSVATLWATVEEAGKRKTTLQAEQVHGDTENLYASGHILLVYKETKFMADFAHYDKINSRLIIHGSVRITNPDGSKIETKKIVLDVERDSVVFEKFFYMDSRKTWLSSTKAVKAKDCYRLSQAMFSTCAVNNPDWYLGFSKAEYNAKTKYIKLRDIKFYVGDTPIFYFPYLAFSTSKERSSGLLMPRFGYSGKEGLLYEQPIYWAINPSMDLELNPQIRTARGVGLYSTFRFADSKYSAGSIRMGYFVDTEKYSTEYNLENSSHYGLEGIYKSSNILGKNIPDGYLDALYLNLLLFNDIDYINLQKSKLSHLSDSHLKESRFNYMLHNQNHYLGLNAKYFRDAKKDSNQETLQELPSLRWHKYNSSFGLEAFSYSMDMKLNNLTRKRGTTSKQLDMDILTSYELSFLDNYLKVELSEGLHLFRGDFEGIVAGKDYYSSAVSTHKIRLYSDLIKPYSSGIHTVEWALGLEKQHYFGDGLKEYGDLENATKKDFFSNEPFDESIILSIGQYWHNNDLSLDLRQRVSQTYYPQKDKKWGSLRHELDLNYGNWSIKNLFEYSFEHKAFSEVSHGLIYNSGPLYADIEYFWRKDLELGAVITNEFALGAKYQYSNEVKLFGNVTYDLEHKRSKKWSSGIRYDKGCWSVEFGYSHDTKPILEKDGGGSISSNSFLVKLSLVPFGESEIGR